MQLNAFTNKLNLYYYVIVELKERDMTSCPKDLDGSFFYGLIFISMTSNPRYANGSKRRKNRARIKALGMPCGICGGRLGPIHYDEPSDYRHPLSFVVDEIKPVSRWKEFGYASARACAEDFDNLQPAHYICNQMKSNKINYSIESNKVDRMDKMIAMSKKSEIDGDW